MLLLLTLLACDDPPLARCAAGFVRGDNDACVHESAAPDSAAPEIEWINPPEGCAAPANLGEDALVLTDSLSPGDMMSLYEMLDVELDGTRAYVIGQGGLLLVDAIPGQVSVVGEGVGDRFHRLEQIGNGFLALTHRERGLSIVDVRNEQQPPEVARLGQKGWEGLSFANDRLYVSARDEGVYAIDVSNPQAPLEVGFGAGLSAPWELSDPHGNWIYAADNTLGVVPIDLSDPDNPAVGAAVDLGAAILHVTVSGDWLYASAGGAGIMVLSLADPAKPEWVLTLETNGSAVMTAVAENLLYAVDHVGLAVWDVTSPASPLPLGRDLSPQYALGVAAADDVAWVTDWTAFEAWSIDRTARSPDVILSSSSVLFPVRGATRELTLQNLGGGDLELSGATVSDPRLTVYASTDRIAPGESGLVQIVFTNDEGSELDATLCLATNDADGPLLSVPLATGSDDAYIGEPAPDFVLTSLDGEVVRLSEQIGHPVMLVYFATW